MVFNVCVGVKDLLFADSSSPTVKFAMLVADTVEIVEGEQMSVATGDIPKELREITYLVGDDEDDDDDGSGDDKKKSKSKEDKKKKKADGPAAAALDPGLGVSTAW